MRKSLLFIALCAFLAVPGLLVAGWKHDDKIYFVELQNGTNRQLFALATPVSPGDALGLQASLMRTAQNEQLKGNDSFLRAVAAGITIYSYSGSICEFYTFTGRHMACGQCGGPGCAVMKTITQ